MTKRKNSTKPPRRKQSHFGFGLDPKHLNDLSAQEIWDLFDAINTVSSVISGLSCQPRFMGNIHHSFNKAGDILDSMAEAFAGLEDGLASHASERLVDEDDVEGAEYKGRIAIRHALNLTDDLSEIAILTASAARDIAQARFIRFSAKAE